jgi:gluconate 2-dehydrogenase gamma chain
LKSTLVAISTVTLSDETPSVLASPGTAEKQERSLNNSEKRFLESAVDRLIPPDERWPGARQAGVVNYIDLQMAGAWGRGDMLYRHGPFRAGTPSQGFQLEYTPAELFRRSIAAINAHFSRRGTSFDQLPSAEQDSYLASLEKGGIDLDGVPCNVFFELLLKHTGAHGNRRWSEPAFDDQQKSRGIIRATEIKRGGCGGHRSRVCRFHPRKRACRFGP